MIERTTAVNCVTLGLLFVVAGCISDDARLVEATREADRRQAEQNRLVSQQSLEVAQGTRRLVEADVEARQELLGAQVSLDQQRNAIEAERKQLATERHRDPIVGNAIDGAVTLIACLLPILLAMQTMRNLGRPNHDDALAEVLIQEIVSDQSVLLPETATPLPVLKGGDKPALPNDE